MAISWPLIIADIAALNHVVPMGSLPQGDRSYVAVYVVASVIPVTALVVCVRVYARRAVVNSFSIDDWEILAAMVRLPASVPSSEFVFGLT